MPQWAPPRHRESVAVKAAVAGLATLLVVGGSGAAYYSLRFDRFESNDVITAFRNAGLPMEEVQGFAESTRAADTSPHTERDGMLFRMPGALLPPLVMVFSFESESALRTKRAHFDAQQDGLFTRRTAVYERRNLLMLISGGASASDAARYATVFMGM